METGGESTSILSPPLPPLIEGIGNEALLGVSILLLLLFISLPYLLKSLSQPPGLARFAAQDPDGPTPDEVRRQFLAERRSEMRRHYRDRQCPVCLAEARFAVETNCGHLFCGDCLITYWRTQHPSRLNPMLCPCCRQTVSILFANFAETEGRPDNAGNGRASDDDDAAAADENDAAENRSRVTSAVNDYNRRFSGEPRPWLEYVYDLPVILRHLASELFTVGGLATLFRLRVVVLVLCCLLYVISPLDVVPEAIFGLLGLLDDLFIVLMVAIYLSMSYREILAARGHGD